MCEQGWEWQKERLPAERSPTSGAPSQDPELMT